MQLQLGQESNGNGTPELYETGTGLQLNFGVMLVFWALMSALTEGELEAPSIELSGTRKRRSNRLFYMEKTPKGLKTISRTEADKAKRQIPDALYAVWALNADQARSKIGQGQGERYSDTQATKAFAGHLLNCIGWQKVVSKKGNEITRCFIYAPNCKTKGCVKETSKRRAEGGKPKEKATTRQQLKEAKKEYRIKRMIETAKEEETAYKAGKTNNDWSLVTKEAIENYKIGKYDSVIEKAWDSSFAYYDREFDRTHAKTLQGYYTSCKTYFRTAAGKLKCAKYALTCDSDVECASQKAPIPWAPIPQKAEPEYSEQAIKSVAKMLSDEMNETLDDTKRVMRLVQEYGGIAPYKSGYLSEEYKDIPSKYKSHEGIKIDELSQEIGMTQAELVEAINKAEDARLRLPKGKRRFSIKEMMFDAEQFLAKSEAEGFAGLADLETYYWKQTGEKVLVSDFPSYARGPAFSRADRYRYGLYDEKKEKYGSLSYREIEKLLSTTKPSIQLRLFGIKYNQSGFAGLGKFKKLTSKERIEPGGKPKREPEQQERQIIQAKLDWQKKIKLQIDRFDQLKPGDRIWNTFVKGYYKVVKVNQKSVILDSEQLYKKFGKGEPMPDRMKFNYTEPLRRLSPKDEKVEFEKFYKSSDKPTPQTKTVTSRTKPEQLRLFGRLLALRIAGKERRLQ